MITRVRDYLSGPGLGPLLVKAVTGSAGLRIAGMGFAFLVGVQLARGLGAEGYGIYGVAMSIIALLTVPTEFGLPQLLTREVAAAQVRQDWGRMKGILRWSTRVSMLIASVIAVGVVGWLLISGRGLGSPLGMTLLAGVAMVPLVALVSLRSAALRGLQHIVKGQLPDVLMRPAFYSLLLFFVPLLTIPLTPALAMALGAMSAGLALLVAQWMLHKLMPPEASAYAVVSKAGDWRASAIPMAMSEGMRVMQKNSIILLLGLMTTASTVGIFRVSVSVSLLLAVPTTILGTVVSPRIPQLHVQGDRRKLQKMLSWSALMMTLSTLALITPFLLFGEWMLNGLFGAAFIDALPSLLILSFGTLASCFFGVNSILLNMTGYHQLVTRATLVSFVSMVLLGLILIHLAADVGGAMAVAISTVIWRMIMWRDAKRVLGVDASILGTRSRIALGSH